MEEAGVLYTICTGGGSFLDPYNGEPGIILDDARAEGGSGVFAWWLRILDRYAFHVNVKYGGVQLRARYIIITAPLHPKEWAEQAWPAEDAGQLLRRITAITRFSGEVECEAQLPVAPSPVTLDVFDGIYDF